jgi:hypothetical protein
LQLNYCLQVSMDDERTDSTEYRGRLFPIWTGPADDDLDLHPGPVSVGLSVIGNED